LVICKLKRVSNLVSTARAKAHESLHGKMEGVAKCVDTDRSLHLIRINIPITPRAHLLELLSLGANSVAS